MPDPIVHLRPAQQLLHAGLVPRGRRGRVFMQEVRSPRQLLLVELNHVVQVDSRRHSAPLHLLRVHAGVVDIDVQGAPIRARWAPHQEVRLASGNDTRGLPTVARHCEVPGVSIGSGPYVEGPSGEPVSYTHLTLPTICSV
eukprot:4333384-Prorocentrum_lima.AAC.1